MTIEGDLVQGYVELGFLYITMTRNVDATSCANSAANIEPNDPRIAALRSAIKTQDTADSVGGAWRWRGWGAVPARR